MATERNSSRASIADALFRPVDPASLAACRVLFGALMLVVVARYFFHGWIDDLYLRPRLFFPWPGLEWIAPWPGRWMYVHFAVLGLAATGITLGLYYRASALVFCAGFTWVHLIDRTNYLNHYYLISLLALLLACMPLGRVFSLDVRFRRVEPLRTVPAWCLWVLRFQLGIVYFFGGCAKLDRDWLLEAQPLRAWLAARAEMPLGHLLAYPVTAHLFAAGGAAFDLIAPFALTWRRTRAAAYVTVVVFHLLTSLLFPAIGVFPWLMIAMTPIFFEPGWPRRFGPAIQARSEPAPSSAERARRPWVLAALGIYAAIQLTVPLRFLLLDGDVLWSERGFRFAWRVMLMEKHGHAEFIVTDPDTGERWRVDPYDRLTRLQAFMLATQPDLILSYARALGDEWRSKGHPRVEVRAEVEVSLNGRPRRPLIDRGVDLLGADATTAGIVAALEGSETVAHEHRIR